MRLYDFLRSIVAQLGDDRPGKPFMRYPMSLVLAFYNEAMCFVATNRPDLFTEIVIVKLQPGIFQDARCCDCNNVLELVAQVDAQGNILRKLDTADATSSSGQQSRWFRPVCRTVPADGGAPPPYVLSTYEIQLDMNGVFSVDPPLPPGVDAWVAVKCVKNPLAASDDGVMRGASTPADCKFLPGIRSYVLYRLLQGDRLAVGAATEAQNELKNAYSYFGLQMKNEKAQEEAS